MFITQLADRAGHDLDLSHVTQARMYEASIQAHEKRDPTGFREMIDEGLDAQRLRALERYGQHIQESILPNLEQFSISTAAPGERLAGTLIDYEGDHCLIADRMNRFKIGNVDDLPAAPRRGEDVSFQATGAERALSEISPALKALDQSRDVRSDEIDR